MASLADRAERLRLRMTNRHKRERCEPPMGAAGSHDLAELARIVRELAETIQPTEGQ